MKQSSWRNPALVIALLITCVLGCKSSGSSTNSSADVTQSNQLAHNTAPVAIDGKYNVTGTNPNGSAYRGTLEVIKHGSVYQFRWNAGVQYDGVGVQNGDVVAVAFTGGANGKGCGVVNYEIKSDGALNGNWGYWGTDESGTEEANRTMGTGLIGTYAATGKNPNGTQYKAGLVVTPYGNNFRFAWSNNTDGIGIQRGDHVAVGIGGTRCGFVFYEINSDGVLDGVWGGYGTNKTGTEKATKQ